MEEAAFKHNTEEEKKQVWRCLGQVGRVTSWQIQSESMSVLTRATSVAGRAPPPLPQRV